MQLQLIFNGMGVYHGEFLQILVLTTFAAPVFRQDNVRTTCVISPLMLNTIASRALQRCR